MKVTYVIENPDGVDTSDPNKEYKTEVIDVHSEDPNNLIVTLILKPN